MYRVLLLILLFNSSQIIAQDSTIINLEKRLQQETGLLQSTLKIELAKQYFFYSFKYPDSIDFRKSTLSKSFNIAKETGDSSICTAIQLQLSQFLPNDTAIKILIASKNTLENILKNNSSQTIPSLAYATMNLEIIKFGGFKRFLSAILYEKLPDASYDIALLHLLLVKNQREFLCMTFYRLAECYFGLRNNRDAVQSLKACINEDEKYPYIDVYFKKEAKKTLAEYLKKNK